MAACLSLPGAGDLVSTSIDQEMNGAVREAVGLLQAFRAGDTATAVEVIETMDQVSLGRLTRAVAAVAGLATAFPATCDHVAEEASLATRSEHILKQAMITISAGSLPTPGTRVTGRAGGGLAMAEPTRVSPCVW